MKKKLQAIYPELPTDIKQVETVLATKRTAREAAITAMREASAEVDNLDREIKHLTRQAGFILGTEEPAPGELERIEARKERAKKEAKANK